MSKTIFQRKKLLFIWHEIYLYSYLELYIYFYIYITMYIKNWIDIEYIEIIDSCWNNLIYIFTYFNNILSFSQETGNR